MQQIQAKFRLKFVTILIMAAFYVKLSSSSEICAEKITCQDCIQTSTCAWCSEPNFEKPRCHVADEEYCPGNLTVDPRNEFSETVTKNLSKASKNEEKSDDEIVQIYPQGAQLKLRLGETYKMDVKYSQAEDYPVDLYYLMDLSQSMKDDLASLSQLGVKLSKEMRKITGNFRLGFGAFVEKVLMPFVSTVPKLLKDPCDGNSNETSCAAPYGFKNYLPLSDNTNRFQEEVKGAHISSNLDGPEGGLDALLQVVVCREQIGWRSSARRLLLFSTDNECHFAGDGKLAGLIIPNDGKCHLDENQEYSYSSLQDYPSISQVNKKVKENSINVIFAVTEDQLEVYEGLAKLIDGSSAAALSNDSSNIVTLVQEQYNIISSSIELKDNHTEGLLDIKYFSKCKDGIRKHRNKCDDLKVNDMMQFDVEITLLKCPENPEEWTQILRIYPVGINESLTVNIELLCGCPCEKTGQTKAAECSGVGTLRCGVCDCGTSFTGSMCECPAERIPAINDPDACRPTSNASRVCNDRGVCKCGACECNKRENPGEEISGNYCECDNFSCPRINGQMCNGNGQCNCGKCACNSGWTGSSCDCTISTERCIPEGGGELCSGHGNCECGTCRCTKTKEGRFTGSFCERCITCPGRRCSEYEDCVLCKHFKTGSLSKTDCSSKCHKLQLSAVPSLSSNEEAGDKRCTFSHNQCRYEFMYNEYTNSAQVHVLDKPDCPEKPFTLGLILIGIGVVVLVGLAALLIWKLVASVCDRREYARFEQERSNAKFNEGENPLYKEPTSTFQNPTFADKMAAAGTFGGQKR